ncbi:MAG: hypothetical protein E5Y51_21510 [Mesorhizobium sp.]|nr:hypothetical protein EJ078_19750 [Mesorhizobium sp. M1A.F.Ca.IN.022.06.1.1]TIN14675.1 MAG: hypothetical protein E5Y51_21510 [Mesorhizobium sp.]
MVWLDTSLALAFYCTKPSAPSCAERYGSFDDEYEFDRCKREMEDFKSEVERFIDCNNQQARSDNEESISDYKDAVESFNRRAGN